jgi:hypothetical protein
VSTLHYEDRHLDLTQFSGGTERGICIQVTTNERPESYCSFTLEQARTLVRELQRWIDDRDAGL